jgi:hypothetical protein
MNDIEDIAGADQIARVLERLRPIVWPISRGFALRRKKDWAAVAMESSLHLSQLDILRVQRAFAEADLDWVYAVAFEALERAAPLLRVSVSVGGLTAFNRKCAQFNYVLCPPDMSSVIVCSASGDYLVVAGLQSFVETAVGKSAADACLEFIKFANDSALTREQNEYFSSLAGVLCNEYPRTPEGHVVMFPKPAGGDD